MRVTRRVIWCFLFAAPLALIIPRKSQATLDAEFFQRHLEALDWPRNQAREDYIVHGVIPAGGKPRPVIYPQQYIQICNPDGSVEIIPIALPPKAVAYREGGHTFYRMDFAS